MCSGRHRSSLGHVQRSFHKTTPVSSCACLRERITQHALHTDWYV
jgi:hypothetical protein